MRARGLGDPVLVVSDGAPGVIRAIEEALPALRPPALPRAPDAATLPLRCRRDLWPEFKARATACYQAPSRAIARDLAAGLVAEYETRLPTRSAASRTTSRPASRTSACR